MLFFSATATLAPEVGTFAAASHCAQDWDWRQQLHAQSCDLGSTNFPFALPSRSPVPTIPTPTSPNLQHHLRLKSHFPSPVLSLFSSSAPAPHPLLRDPDRRPPTVASSRSNPPRHFATDTAPLIQDHYPRRSRNSTRVSRCGSSRHPPSLSYDTSICVRPLMRLLSLHKKKGIETIEAHHPRILDTTSPDLVSSPLANDTTDRSSLSDSVVGCSTSCQDKIDNEGRRHL